MYIKMFQLQYTGGAGYLQTFYLRIRLFTLKKRFEMTIFKSKMDFLSTYSRFVVQNDGTYRNNEGNLYLFVMPVS